MISIPRRRLASLASASALIATMAVATLPAATMAATIFDNGSFDSGNFVQTFPGYDIDRLSTGSTDITGWTVTNGSVDWIGSGYWQAAPGSTRSIDLDGDEG